MSVPQRLPTLPFQDMENENFLKPTSSTPMGDRDMPPLS